MEGTPSPARVPQRLLVDLLEEEAIVGEQERKEEKEKEKEKEEKELGFVSLNMFSILGGGEQRLTCGKANLVVGCLKEGMMAINSGCPQ